MNLVGELVDSGKRPSLATECPARLWALIERCRAYRPDKRPTMAEVCACFSC